MRQSWISPRLAGAALAAVVLSSFTLMQAAGKVKPTEEWSPITPEEQKLTRIEQDPEADVVILNNERNGKILKRADDWVNVMDYHWRAKVLTAAGKELEHITTVKIPGGKHSRVTNIKARTIKPDGTVVVVPEGQIFKKTTTYGGAQMAEWVFSFPAVEVGSILEYKYDRHDSYLIYVRPFYFEGGGYTRRARLTQAMPEEARYQFLCSRCPPGVQPKVAKWVEGPARGQRYELELANLPGYEGEVLMPPQGEVSPRLDMVLHSWKNWYSDALGRQDRMFIDWPSVATYTQFYYDNAMKEGQTELRTAVSGWIEGLTDPGDKMKAILRHVRDDFRDIAWDYIVGWSRPLDKLFEELSADNEEKAVLLRAALAQAGIPSQFALVAGRHVGIFNPDFFGMSQFTHVVVAVPGADGSYTWLDPTVPYAPYGFIPWKDSGAKALLIKEVQGTKERQGQIVEMPVKNETGRRRFEVTVRPREDGKADLVIQAEFSGEDAIDWRGSLAPIGSEVRRDWLVEWLQHRLPGASLGAHQVENLEAVDEPLKIRLEAVASGIVTRADEALLVQACLLTGFDSNPIRRPTRRHNLCVDRGWNIQESVLIETPAGMQPAPLPASAQADAGVARMSFQCVSTLEGNVRCSRLYSAPRKRWPASHMEQFRKMMDKLVQADRTSVVFQRKPPEGS